MLDETVPRADPWKVGTVVAGRYEILEHLGTGGMGVVYRVKDLSNERIRALKTIRADLDGETKRLVARLLKAEADALRRLESDFVVRIYDASLDEQAERPFVVMEFLPGRDLHQLLQKQGPLPVPATVGLLWQAACALKTIHQQGIVHRDLKPANLYLRTREDGSIELKVLDFSISRLLDRAGERKTTMVVGTRGFMAPEQAAGYDVDHRADIYALGQVASSLLQAQLTAEESDAGATAAPARLQAFNNWHAKACAFQREQRFQSATEAIEALAAALGVPLPNRELPKGESPESMTTAATVSVLPKLRWSSQARTLALAGVVAAAATTWWAMRRPSAPPAGLVGRPIAGADNSSAPASAAPPATVASTLLHAPASLASASGVALPSGPPSSIVKPKPAPKRPQSAPAKPPETRDGTEDRE